MKNLKFEKGIRKLLSKCDGGAKPLKLSNDGLDLLCGLCTDINARLIDDCKVEFRNQMTKPNVRGELNFTPFYVSNVIKRTFRRRLKEHALAEGEKGVMKYKNQLIDYDPRGALTPVKKSITDFDQLGKHPTEPDHMFMTKIGLLLNHVHHDLTMTSKARKHCSETLYTIVNKLIAKTAQVATGKVNVGTEDVCEAMKYLLGEVMYEHAKNEGDNSIRMFRDDHSRDGALQTYSRLKNVTHTVSESYGTVKGALTGLHQQYEDSKSERNILRRHSLFKTMIKAVVRLDAQYWLLIDVPRQEKQEQVATYVLRACAALEKTAESKQEANSSKHHENHREGRLDDMTIEEIEDENSQQINDFYRLLKKYANLKKIVHELNMSYTGSKVYPIIPRYNFLKEMIKDVLRHPHYMEVCHEDG